MDIKFFAHSNLFSLVNQLVSQPAVSSDRRSDDEASEAILDQSIEGWFVQQNRSASRSVQLTRRGSFCQAARESIPGAVLLFAGISFVFSSGLSHAEDEKPSRGYSPAVVAKAEKILADNGLRRSGKSLMSSIATDLSKAMSGLSRDKRDLKSVHKEWVNAESNLRLNREQIKQLTRQYAELNNQLAVAAGIRNTSRNNQLVGLINANTAQRKLMTSQQDALKETLGRKRSALNVAESKYAEKILSLRSDFENHLQELGKTLTEKQVRTAIQVLSKNFDVASDLNATKILATVNRRLSRLEQEVFSETIPLEVVNRSLYVDVVVDGKPTRMVVDSGASLLTLPAATATNLSIETPPDAPDLRLVMADGREIAAKRVTIDKVRVGDFIAEDVDAAVLSATAVGAEPLLGMSYLGNFKFEIDAASKTLKMLRVAAE